MAELMYESATTNHSTIVYDHFTGELCGIGDDHIVAYDTIVCDVAICHDQAVVANHGLAF